MPHTNESVAVGSGTLIVARMIQSPGTKKLDDGTHRKPSPTSVKSAKMKFELASIPSKSVARVGTPANGTVSISIPTRNDSFTNRARAVSSCTTAKRHGCLLQADGATRAASNINSKCSRGTGLGSYARQLVRY